MLQISTEISIPSAEIEIKAIRAQGAGGQNVNKVASAVHLRFDIRHSSLPPVIKERLIALNDSRINKNGIIIIKAQEERTQKKNREIALSRLKILIQRALNVRKKRMPTRPTSSSRIKRLESKSRRGKLKSLRQKIDRGSGLLSAVLIITVFLSANAFAQTTESGLREDIQIIPRPKVIAFTGRAVTYEKRDTVVVLSDGSPETSKAFRYFEKLLTEKFSSRFYLNLRENPDPQATPFHIRLSLRSAKDPIQSEQRYHISYQKEVNRLELEAYDQLGLLYAVVTLSEFFEREQDTIKLYLYTVEDWPSYRRRIFSAIPDPSTFDQLLDFALRYKFETIALASRQYSWHTLEPDYKKILQAYKSWFDTYGGPRLMQSHNLYTKGNIVISDPNHLGSLKMVIREGIVNGADRLMILADDTPPFRFGDGYIQTDERDIKKFPHLAAAHCHLLNQLRVWLQENNLTCEIFYVPAFYSFEDAKYGDLFLYQDTPWEKEAFAPLERDLAYIGEHLPPEIFIVWTGPNVRSRTIRKNQLEKWTALLQGRIPFLWDNTIYSQHPFTTTALLTAYNNDLPAEFAEITAGNGMFINGNANDETMQIAAITTNDFLWHPEAYEPQESLIRAIQKRYGEDLVSPLLAFKDVELALRKKVGERALWFAADTLWHSILSTKTVTAKNPFPYHFNYSRLKALRMQLQYSVPPPISNQEFDVQCQSLEKKRAEILAKIKEIDPEIFRALPFLTTRE